MNARSLDRHPTLDHPVWQALSSYNIGPDDAAFSFAQRLARENGWSATQADRAIEEYRRFCFLAVTAGHELIPSDAVDQVWHLHLSYTRDYWERFCPQILRASLHHGPTAGGTGERARFHEQYAATLRRYEAVFGPAPPDIWPDAQRSLIEDPKARRVHPRDAIVISRAVLRRWLLLLATVFVVVTLLYWWRS